MTIFFDRISHQIGVVKINNPQNLNALSADVLEELTSIIDSLATEDGIRVVIFTGEGKAFVAGADISEMNDMTPREAFEYAELGARLFQKIETLNLVTVAAINGYVLGGGCELAMACDIRVASNNAKFGQPEVGLGIIPGFSGIRRMMDIIGEARAKEYIFSGRIFDAREAERIGLVHKVVSPESLMKECQQIAEEIASKSFNAVVTSKIVMNALKGDVNEKTKLQSKFFSDCFKHKDQKEGMTAFLKKEKPSFH